MLGPMGSVHIQTASGDLVYNIPYASTNYAHLRYAKRMRMPGSIIKEQGNNRVIAEGAWLEDYDVSSDTAYLEDPHHMDETGSAMVQGNFFVDDKDSEHFAVGAPKANKLTGKVYVCYKCFNPRDERKDDNNENPSFQV